MSQQEMPWQHTAFVYEVDQCRSGWPGVWDAIKAAVSGMNRPVAPRPYTVEFWVAVKDAGLRSNEQHARERQVYIDGVLHRGSPYELPALPDETELLEAQAEAEHRERVRALGTWVRS